MNHFYIKSPIILFIVSLFALYPLHANSQSVLAQGQWFQVAVEKDGIYQLTFQDFEEMGFDASNINPNNIQVFGNIEGVLPEANNIIVPLSLTENPIYVQGAADNSFDEGDYILFYGKGPDEWQYERLLERFRYYSHPYDEQNYYYVTIAEEPGKRIGTVNSVSSPPFKVVESFLDYQAHEVDLINFVKSGRKWFGETFDENNNLNFDFDFPNMDASQKVSFGIYAAGRSSLNSTITIEPDNVNSFELTIPKVTGNYIYAKEASSRFSYYPSEPNVSLNLSYSKPDASSYAWIDYLEVTAHRKLMMTGHQMAFSFDVMLDANKLFKFKLASAVSDLKIWDVSNPYEVKQIIGTHFANDTLDFSLQLDDTHYFVAFDSEEFMSPTLVQSVANQDLKGLEPFDMAIITVDEFKEEAQRLADFHATEDQLRVVVVSTQEIYNEFSSGKQDPSAIRNFLKYHYNKNAEADKPAYLLLFGDASYDYKDILQDNTNIVAVYQSEGSTSLTETYNTDDFYGIMGQQDGDSSLGEIQLSIGRFPVHSLEDAKIMVDKTIHYASNQKEQMDDWRNKVCFIADDEDSNLHFNDSNKLADTFLLAHPEFNVDKIFLDSYVQTSTPNGNRYPDVVDAINKSINNGVLFVNYTGHGGHIALSDERVVQIPDILSWKNYDKLSVFIVASCEFGPFDNPEHVSAGEHVVLNPYGGGVALFTTTRLAYASYNFSLNSKFHEIAFSRKEDGSHYRLGEIIKYAKNESGNKEKNLNFCLLGDPALKMAYPEYHIETTKINGTEISTGRLDTLKARQLITVEGRITGLDYQLLSNFNGNMKVCVYDKASVYSTLANDPKSYAANFEIIDKLIYQGLAKVNSGIFEFSFVVPTAVGTSFGPGKISYYATKELANGTYEDANGGFLNFIIGGVDDSIENDLKGPDISIHMDSYDFKSGDPTTTNPTMIVDLFDKDGINNIQLGLGKEIIARLDNTSNYYLNDYYLADTNSFQNGQIRYQLNQLDYGIHELIVKAWDMLDNVSEKSVSFVVVSPNSLDIFNLINYPNPFSEHTDIVFNHNQINENELTVNIQIFDILGNKVWQYDNKANVIGNSIEPIGINQSDISLKTGLYTYLLDVKNKEGQKVQQKQKMIVVK